MIKFLGGESCVGGESFWGGRVGGNTVWWFHSVDGSFEIWRFHSPVEVEVGYPIIYDGF